MVKLLVIISQAQWLQLYQYAFFYMLPLLPLPSKVTKRHGSTHSILHLSIPQLHEYQAHSKLPCGVLRFNIAFFSAASPRSPVHLRPTRWLVDPKSKAPVETCRASVLGLIGILQPLTSYRLYKSVRWSKFIYNIDMSLINATGRTKITKTLKIMNATSERLRKHRFVLVSPA